MALTARRLNSEYASIVMRTSITKRTLVGADGSRVAGQFGIACIPTLQGFMLGLIDAREQIRHTSSRRIHLSPLAAIKAMQLLHYVGTLTIEWDDVVREFDDFALSFVGELEGERLVQLARRLGSSSAGEFIEELQRLPDPEELKSIFDWYSDDDGETFWLSIEPTYDYMSVHGDIDCLEAAWLQRNGFVPLATR